MTTISVVKKDRLITIACDSTALLGTTVQNANDVDNGGKIIAYSGGYIAYCGHSSIGDCLELYLQQFDDIDFSSRSSIFKESLRMFCYFKNELYLNDVSADCDFEELPFDLLIANKNGIFGLYSERSVSEYKAYYSLGTGYKFALGSMYTNYDDPKLTSQDIAVQSIGTAIHFDSETGGKIDVKTIVL